MSWEVEHVNSCPSNCRISNVANVAYATGLALSVASRHPKLKRIKDAQRSTMIKNRLNNLTLMSVKYELLRIPQVGHFRNRERFLQ